MALGAGSAPVAADEDDFDDDIEAPMGLYKPDPVIFQAGVSAYDRGDYETAYQTWLPMARGGDLAAMRNVGHLLRLGLGTEKDLPRALFFYRRAATRGLAGAQANLGLMHLNGEGTAPNPKEAARWFYAAARRGHVLSTYELGRLLEEGKGVEQSLEVAYDLYARAAAEGHQPAIERLRFLDAKLDVAPPEAAGLTASIEPPAPTEPRSARGKGPDLIALANVIETSGIVGPEPPQPRRKPAPPAPEPLAPGGLAPLSLRGPISLELDFLDMPVNDTPVAAGYFTGSEAPGR